VGRDGGWQRAVAGVRRDGAVSRVWESENWASEICVCFSFGFGRVKCSCSYLFPPYIAVFNQPTKYY
jgi:hypothetical protein